LASKITADSAEHNNEQLSDAVNRGEWGETFLCPKQQPFFLHLKEEENRNWDE
jgi:hypothetical protein